GGRKHYPFVGEGTAVNSGAFTGLPTAEFKKRITAWLEERGLGQGKVNYKLRDWLFSRQRYWGEPFPILHEVDAAGGPTGVGGAPEGRGRAAGRGRASATAARPGGLQAVGPPRAAAGQGDRLGERHPRRQALPARDEYDAAVGRLVLVLPALH